MHRQELRRLRDDVVAALRSAGCVAVGVCGVEPLVEARRVIEQRKAAGLHGSMEFTYRNPQRSSDPTTALPSARSAVVVAWPYRSDVAPRPEEPSASVARYAATDTYDELRGVLGVAGELLEQSGHRAVVVADDNALVDRAIALRAGLGWLGKNTNLLVPGEGSWVVIGTVLTDVELDGMEGTSRRGGCGNCTRCLPACPTGALVAPGVMDASRCLSWLLQARGSFPRQFRRSLGVRIYGCDDCQEVCPPNAGSQRVDPPRRVGQAPDQSDARGGPGDWVTLRFLLESTDSELLASLGAWYIPGRDPRFVRRNALVALGNSECGRDPAALSLLSHYLRVDDELLVEHAAWAARALGRDDLLRPLEVAARPAVVAERARPHPRSHPALAAGAPTGETGPDARS